MLKKVTPDLAARMLCTKLHEHSGHFYPKNVRQTFHEACTQMEIWLSCYISFCSILLYMSLGMHFSKTWAFSVRIALEDNLNQI